MPEPTLTLVERLKSRFADVQLSIVEARGEVTLEVAPEHWLATARTLRDEPEFHFELCMDVCGVDYLSYGQVEWDNSEVSRSEENTSELQQLMRISYVVFCLKKKIASYMYILCYNHTQNII